MVSHDIRVQGIALNGTLQPRPAILQMNNEDFPARFLTDLAALAPTPGSSIEMVATSPDSSPTLYQPVQRMVNLALLDLTCESVGFPRLDPTRVQSAGIVIRRVIRTNGVDDLSAPPSAWMKSSDGQFQWLAMTKLQERQDPDPTKRPQLQSGQPELDRLLAQQAITTAMTEISTPAFVAPPAACNSAGHTFVYAVVPTASSDVTTNAPAPPQYSGNDLTNFSNLLPNLLTSAPHSPIYANNPVTYLMMTDDYAKANGASAAIPFTTAVRILYTFGAFQPTPAAQALIEALNGFNVYDSSSNATPMGTFYQNAAAALLDYDPTSGPPVPSITMPAAWDQFSMTQAASILSLLTALAQNQSAVVSSPMGRFQDSSRLYRLRVFIRVKAHTPQCPPALVWSKFSDPFRIAAWHESGARALAPVPLPDPTDRNFLKNAKPNCAFAVPASLMNAMNGSTLSGLSAGTPPSNSGIQLNWICGFSIPLITICAFFVLNIFLTLLNLCFFWLPFIKICIPFPLPSPSNSGDTNGT
jgi:hypothetical protein